MDDWGGDPAHGLKCEVERIRFRGILERSMVHALNRSRGMILRAAVALAALAAATAYRIWLLARIPDQGFFAKYPAIADEILAGRIPASRLGDLSPGYLWLVVALRSIGFEPFGIRTLQVVAVSAGIAAIGWTTGRRFGPAAGIAAATGLLLSRALLLNAAELEPETAVFLWLSLLLASLGSQQPRTPWMAGVAGLAAGLAVVTRPSNLLAALVGAVWIASAGSRRVRNTAVYGSALLAPVAAILLTNFALAGEAILMNPGTVFYEGANPLATGYGGVAPRVVTDLEQCIDQPDALHVSYRVIAARALGAVRATPRQANRFWTALALQWAHYDPGGFARLIARKAAAAIQSYEAWDLSTLERKSRFLERLPWLPFGLLFAAGVAGLLLHPSRVTAFTAMIAVSGIAVMVIFYVSARQRNAVLPALAVLAGIATARLIDRWREGKRARATAIVLAVLVAGALLSVPSNVAREHRYLWTARFAADDLARRAASAEAAGAIEEGRVLRAFASTWDPELAAQIDPGRLLAVSQSMMLQDAPPERLFDAARALVSARRPLEAEAILARLAATGYRPMREAESSSSIALIRARAALHAGRAERARRFAEQALEEAPNDPSVLAIAAVTRTDADAMQRLEELHDPFTTRLAQAVALADAGRTAEAQTLIDRILRALPEASCHARAWSRRVIARTPGPPEAL